MEKLTVKLHPGTIALILLALHEAHNSGQFSDPQCTAMGEVFDELWTILNFRELEQS